MKNTISLSAGKWLDNSCTCQCVDYVNDGTNSIVIAFQVPTQEQTGEEYAENPYIQLTLRDADDKQIRQEKISVEWGQIAYVTLPDWIYKPNHTIVITLMFEETKGIYPGQYFYKPSAIMFPNKLEGNLTIKHGETKQIFVAKYTVITGGGGQPYELPIASKDILGGIKVGRNLSIEEDGTLNAEGGGGTQITVDDHLSETSENPVQNKVIAIKLNEVFQSVSDGKEKVAAAITDKGQPTAADATFQTMADNVLKIMSAGVITYSYSLIGKTGIAGTTTY